MIEYSTVPEAIRHIGTRWPTHGFTFQDLAGRERFYSFVEIEAETAHRAAALQEFGVRKGDRIGIVIVEPQDFVLTFLAALRIGAAPVPAYPPLSLGNVDSYSKRIARMFASAEASLLVASHDLRYILWAVVGDVPTMRRLVTAEELAAFRGTPEYPEVSPDDLAFLQYTSGSTDEPKGVMVTHACLIANAEGNMGPGGLCMDPERDSGVTWLPLYHDMGLIGFVISTVCWGVSVVFIPTIRFLRNPSVWMETMHRHRATTSFGPNFAYGLLSRKAKQDELDRWDLSCVKVLGCGGEPVNPETIRAFSQLFHERTRMPLDVVRPGYGSAEVTLTISLTPMSEAMRVHRVDAERFAGEGVAVPAADGKPAFEHVACGVAIPGHDIQIVDSSGNPVPDGVEGEVLFRGPSVARGYYGNPTATGQMFQGGWLRSGDLGYLLDRHIYVTGRLKDLIIYNGRNYHPQTIEWAVGEDPRVRKGNVVAFSVPGDETEQLVVVVETRETDHEPVVAAVKTAVQRETGLVPIDVVCLAPGALPKTSSGKLQRSRTRSEYLAGALGESATRAAGASNRLAVARQVARSLWTRITTRA